MTFASKNFWRKGWTFPYCSIGYLAPKEVNLYYWGSKIYQIIFYHKVNNLYISFTLIITLQQLSKMHMGMWHAIIQCTVVLGLSLKDTCLYPNTLSIWSLFGVNFCVFHTRDLTHFLIHFSQALLFLIIFFSFFISYNL